MKPLLLFLLPTLTSATPSHRVVEGLTNVFWLATWASLASYASALNVANAGYYFVLAGRQLGIGSDAPPPPPHGAGGPDGGRGPGSAGAGSVGGGPGGPGPTGSSAAAAARSSIQAARISIAVDAGLGAVIWVLFIITLIATSEYLSSSQSPLLGFHRRRHVSPILMPAGSTDTMRKACPLSIIAKTAERQRREKART